MRNIKKVCFVYVGPLKFRGRLLKQIRTLQSAGIDCFLIHGRTEPERPDYSVYDFPVVSLRVLRGHNIVAEKLKVPILMAGLTLFSRRAAGIAYERGADAVVSVALFAGLAGAMAKRKRPEMLYVFDSNELFLETCAGPKRAILARVQRMVLNQADVILHAERRRMEYFHEHYETNAQPYVLENLPYFQNNLQKRRYEHGKTRCVYLGGFMPARCCVEMLEAFADLGGEGVRFDMVGFFDSPSYEKEVMRAFSRIRGDAVRILPPVPNSDILDFLRDYDIGVAFYANTNLNNYYCAPNKVYEYIQMELPVITNDYPGLVDVVRHNRIGVCVEKIDRQNIGNAIGEICNSRMHENITEEVRRRYSWEHQTPGYLEIFEKTLADPGKGR